MASAGLSAILPLVPVVSSTCSLWFAWDQYEFLTLFRKPDLQPLSNKLLPSYFTSFFNRGAPRVLGLLSTTALSCGAILRYSPGTILHDRGAFPCLNDLVMKVSYSHWDTKSTSPLSCPAYERFEGMQRIEMLRSWRTGSAFMRAEALPLIWPPGYAALLRL
ncbi:hypothetical protein F4775DRAFT_595385 [Biscogniauxia sp. FL1348]|nr:hypothetical protein F4775DRAFT_595385 [Biscogniauxia sp. FL1348]